MPIVPMPDGTNVQFPDDMPPEQIKALILKKFPDAAQMAAQQPVGWQGPEMSVGEDIKRTIGPGLIRGAAGLIGAPGAIAEFGARGIDAATRYVGGKLGIDVPPREYAPKERRLPLPQELIADYEAESGRPLYQPQTVPGQYANTAAEFLPASIAGPGGPVSNAVKFGLVPSVVSETAGQVTKGTSLETPARVGGALVGGAAASLATRPDRVSQTIRSQLPEGVTPQMVNQAEALINDAARQGIQLSWPEALSQVAQRPVLTNTMRHVEASPSSEARMAEFFGQRPQQVDQAAGAQFRAVAPGNPAPSTIGPAAGRAAETTINDVRDIINTRTEPFYTAASTVRLTPQEMQQVRALPGYQEARDAVRGDPQLNRYVAQLPEDSVGFLNEVKKYLDQQAQNAARPLAQNPNMQRAAGYGQDAAAARRIGINASPEYEVALNVQEQTRRQFLEPLLQGPLGKLADRDITTKKAINALFPTNPLPNSADEISTAVSALVQRSPRAARDLVRAHMEGVFNEASQALQSGANQAGGAKFRAVLVGNPQQAANLEAAVRALPNGDQTWAGINRFLDILEATGTRQNVGSRTAYNTEFLKEQATGRLASETVKATANPIQGVKFLADKYERWQLGQNLDDLARIFTDPNAGNLLRAIARLPATNSQRATNVAARIAQLTESADVGPRTRIDVRPTINEPRE